jgi:hypothetical protein
MSKGEIYKKPAVEAGFFLNNLLDLIPKNCPLRVRMII